MAKDPAMLWYWGDWHSGTSLLSRFLKGCYMDLLHAQFNNGFLSLEEIKICLGSDFGQAWPTLQKKFKQSPDGLFFNERLHEEKEKRKKFCNSRGKNREGKSKSYEQSYENHMKPHMENANENVNSINKFSVIKNSTIDEEVKFSIEHCLEIAMKDPRWVNANKAKKEDLERFNKMLEKTGAYEKNPADYKKHYANWSKGLSVETFPQQNKMYNTY